MAVADKARGILLAQKAARHVESIAKSTALGNRRRLAASGTTDAAGTATLALGVVSPGTEWQIERYVVTGAGAAGYVALYLDSVDPTNIIDISWCSIPAHSIWLAPQYGGSPIWAGENRRVLAYFSGHTATSPVAISVQFREIDVERPPTDAHYPGLPPNTYDGYADLTDRDSYPVRADSELDHDGEG